MWVSSANKALGGGRGALRVAAFALALGALGGPIGGCAEKVEPIPPPPSASAPAPPPPDLVPAKGGKAAYQRGKSIKEGRGGNAPD